MTHFEKLLEPIKEELNAFDEKSASIEEIDRMLDKVKNEKNRALREIQDKKYKSVRHKELLFEHCLLKSNKFNEGMRDILDVIDVTRGVEIAMAELGDYDFVDGDHYDNTDFSETKTCGVKLSWGKNDTYTMKYNVTNVVTESGVPKKGDIRLVITNVFNDTVRFFFLPKKFWDNKKNKIWNKSPNYKGTITGTLTKVGGFLTTKTKNLDEFEVDSFETLAKMKSTCLTK